MSAPPALDNGLQCFIFRPLSAISFCFARQSKWIPRFLGVVLWHMEIRSEHTRLSGLLLLQFPELTGALLAPGAPLRFGGSLK